MTTTVESVTRPGEARRWDQPVRLTALYREHLALGAEMIQRDGWLLPVSYGDRALEMDTLRTGVGILDIGEVGQMDVKGSDLDAFLAAAFPDIGMVGVGMAAHSQGSHTRVLRLTRQQALLLTEPDQFSATFDRLCREAKERSFTHITDLTGALCGVRLVGPRAPAILERLSTLDLAPHRFANGAAAQGPFARIHVRIARRDHDSLPSYDLYVDRDLGVYLWQTILEIGSPLGCRPAARGRRTADGPPAAL